MALKTTVIKPAITTVATGSKPNITCPIFIAAKVTPAIANTLNIIPRYTALKLRRNRAGFPPYLSS